MTWNIDNANEGKSKENRKREKFKTEIEEKKNATKRDQTAWVIMKV